MDLSLGFVTWICLNLNWLLAVTGVMHEADDAYSIRSTWSCYWLDQFLTLALNILILSIFYISIDLSINYFAHFSGCWASFVCSCHSILECCVTFSGVKLSIRSFALFIWYFSSCQVCEKSMRWYIWQPAWVSQKITLKLFWPFNIVWWLHMHMTLKRGRNISYKNNTLLMVKA